MNTAPASAKQGAVVAALMLTGFALAATAAQQPYHDWPYNGADQAATK